MYARILIIEDDALILAAMEMIVVSWGHEAVAAVSGQQAVERLGGTPPDLIIADWRLPGGQTGGDAITSIQQLFQAYIPSIIITGETCRDNLRDIETLGYPVLHKPVGIKSLQKAVADVLRLKHNPANLALVRCG